MCASDEFLYCSQCGLKLMKACKFCTKCGAKIKANVVEESTENDYFHLKSNEITGFFKRKERKRTREGKPYKQEINTEVLVFSQRNGHNQYWFD